MPATWIIITFGVMLLTLLSQSSHVTVLGWPLAGLSFIVLSPTIVAVITGVVINLKIRAMSQSAPSVRGRRHRLQQWGEWLLLPFLTAFYFGGAYMQAYVRLMAGYELDDEPTPK